MLSDGGTPISGVHVELLLQGEKLEYSYPEEVEDAELKVITDISGTFRFTRVWPGEWALYAYPNPWVLAWIDPVIVTKGEVKDDLILQLPPTGTLKGRLIGGPDFLSKVWTWVRGWPRASK